MKNTDKKRISILERALRESLKSFKILKGIESLLSKEKRQQEHDCRTCRNCARKRKWLEGEEEIAAQKKKILANFITDAFDLLSCVDQYGSVGKGHANIEHLRASLAALNYLDLVPSHLRELITARTEKTNEHLPRKRHR